MDKETCCRNCSFWLRRENLDNIKIEAGTCRREPPKVFVIPHENFQGPALSLQSVMPNTQGGDWCGMYVALSRFAQ